MDTDALVTETEKRGANKKLLGAAKEGTSHLETTPTPCTKFGWYRLRCPTP